MTKCKKLLVTILGVVFVVACTLGLVACGGGGDDGGDGETYTVTVTDTTDAKTPVENVWLEFVYVATRIVEDDGNPETDEDVGAEYTVTETLATAKTDASGVVKFVSSDKKKEDLKPHEFNPVKDAEYSVKIADHGATAEDRATPYNYVLHTEIDQTTQLPITNFKFDENKNATVTLDYFPNHFYYSERPEHPYYREFVYKGGDPWYKPEYKESEEKTLQLNVKAGGKLNYFDFSPFKNTATLKEGETNPITGLPYTKEEAEEFAPQIPYLATLAATGKYRIAITTSTSGATPVLRQFLASPGYTPLNANGEPTQILNITGSGPSDLFTGTNYIELDLDASQSAACYYFYVTAASDCTVTITVTRTGDATERQDVDTIMVQPSDMNNVPAYAKEKALTALPLDSTVVKGDDGFYHLDTKDGKIIGVLLTVNELPVLTPGAETTMSDRIGETPICDWTNALKSDVESNKIYDYSGLINFYRYYVNDDGVYGLNQDLYDLLHAFGDRFAGATTSSENNWLLPCVYYAEGNTPITAGTPTDLEYEGEPLFFSFTAQADGWYTFEGAEFFSPVPDAIERIDVNGESVYTDYDGRNDTFEVIAGKTYNIAFYFSETNAVYGNTYTVNLVETEGEQNNTLNVGVDQEVIIAGPTATELEFDGAPGEYTITVDPGRALGGYEITVTVGIGPGAMSTTLNDANNYTATFNIYTGDVISFSCESNRTDATIFVTVAATQQ